MPFPLLPKGLWADWDLSGIKDTMIPFTFAHLLTELMILRYFTEFCFYKRSQNLQFLKGLTFCLVCLTALPFSCLVVETCKHPLGWQAAGMQSGRWEHRRWKITFPGRHHWKDVPRAELLESSNLKKITNLLFFILAVPSALNWLTGHHWVGKASRGR